MSSSSQRCRIAERNDAEEVADLLHRFQVEFEEFTPGPAALTPRVRAHIAQDLSVFLLAQPPRVGVAQLRFREYLLTGSPICYVEELYVVPERRGDGHGRRLMETALAVARGRAATIMELSTAAIDAAARSLYASLGFTNLEKDGIPETQMLYYERPL